MINMSHAIHGREETRMSHPQEQLTVQLQAERLNEFVAQISAALGSDRVKAEGRFEPHQPRIAWRCPGSPVRQLCSKRARSPRSAVHRRRPRRVIDGNADFGQPACQRAGALGTERAFLLQDSNPSVRAPACACVRVGYLTTLIAKRQPQLHARSEEWEEWRRGFILNDT